MNNLDPNFDFSYDEPADTFNGSFGERFAHYAILGLGLMVAAAVLIVTVQAVIS